MKIEDLINKHIDQLCYNSLNYESDFTQFEKINPYILNDVINWDIVFGFQKISENFLINNKKYIDWKNVRPEKFFNLSEELMYYCKNYIDWSLISIFKKFSEDFIRRWRNYVDWFYICQYQKLSENFIIEHKNYVHWNLIQIYQEKNISESFKKDYGLYEN